MLNTAIAKAKNPADMAESMYNAAIAGRLAYKAGIMQKTNIANASSPLSGLLKHEV